MSERLPEAREHPGKGEKRGRFRPKGRQVLPAPLAEVREALGDRPRRANLLVQHLHLIQDRFHHISAGHIAALAEEMRMAQAEVYEVATFYAHFHVIPDGEKPPPPITVRVCDSLTCELMGAEALLSMTTQRVASLAPGKKDPPRARVVRAPCMGRCATAPVAEVGHYYIDHASDSRVLEAVESDTVKPEVPRYEGYEEYRDAAGYLLLKRCRDGGLSFDELVATLEESGLRGLGGAGFPAATKWKLVRKEKGPRLFALNADEGEPGTFKDRFYLETEPHKILEGMLIACWAVEADYGVIYLRDEYGAARHILETEIAVLEADGIVEPGYIKLHRGAGAYICGEESAMLESIEGKRGLPRHKPPYPAQVGLFGRPTLIHNVETMYWIRDIVQSGAEWFASKGRRGSKGLRSFSVSGRVADPGVKQAPAGITAQELIDEFCGGMAEGHSFKAYLPGGASGGILPASMADLPLDFGGKLAEHGCFVGSHAIVVLSDEDDMAAVARNLMFFFKDESCGQCTPCRVGTEKALELMKQPTWDGPLLEELSRAMADASICGLGQAASNPMLSVLRHFRSEAEAGDEV